LHAKSVYRLARNNPQSVSGCQIIAPQQASVPLCACVGNLDIRGDHGFTGEIRNLKAPVPRCFLLGKPFPKAWEYPSGQTHGNGSVPFTHPDERFV
jgi:hypothetical protein